MEKVSNMKEHEQKYWQMGYPGHPSKEYDKAQNYIARVAQRDTKAGRPHTIPKDAHPDAVDMYKDAR